MTTERLYTIPDIQRLIMGINNSATPVKDRGRRIIDDAIANKRLIITMFGERTRRVRECHLRAWLDSCAQQDLEA